MQAMALYRTTIGKKAIMALTGAIWIGYVVVHMYGNLKVFSGAVYFNEYAEGLRTLGAPVFGHLHLLFIARVVLVATLIAHVWAAFSLYQQARRARPTDYAMLRVVQANYPSLTMRYGGVFILLFIVYHLMHLTWGAQLVHSDFIRGDAYHNLVVGFQAWPVVLVYLVGLVALALHLYHGTWSMFQTLGLSSRDTEYIYRGVSLFLAIVVPVGFAIVPIAVQIGMVR